MKIAGYHSPHSRGGMLRIKDILAPNYDVGVEAPPPDADLIIMHNMIPTIHNVDTPCIVFLCEEKAMSIPKSLDLQKRLGSYANEVWSSCKAGQEALRGVGIPSRLMYRPNKLIFPEKGQCLTKDKRLLWYWIGGQKKYEDIRQESAEAIRELGDRGWQIDYISSRDVGEPPVVAEYTETIGKVYFPHVMPDVRGMVQINTCRGIGRSCFQVLAYGRPVIGMNLDDTGFCSLSMKDDWASRIEHAFEQEVPHQWVQDEFSEEALNKRFVERVEDICQNQK